MTTVEEDPDKERRAAAAAAAAVGAVAPNDEETEKKIRESLASPPSDMRTSVPRVFASLPLSESLSLSHFEGAPLSRMSLRPTKEE